MSQARIGLRRGVCWGVVVLGLAGGAGSGSLRPEAAAQERARAHLPLVGGFERVGAGWSGRLAREGAWSHMSPTNEVGDLDVDARTGRVWASTYGGLVTWDLDAERYEALTLTLQSVVADDRGGLWTSPCPTAEDGALWTLGYRDPQGRWHCADGRLAESSPIAVDGQGRLFVVDRKNILLRRDPDGAIVELGSLDRYAAGRRASVADLQGGGPPTFVLPDEAGGAWVYRDGDPLWRVDAAGGWHEEALPEDRFSGAYDAIIAPDGALWVAGPQGVWHREAASRWRAIDHPLFEDRAVWSIAFRPDGEAWFAIGDGLVRMDPSGGMHVVVPLEGFRETQAPEELRYGLNWACMVPAPREGVLICGGLGVGVVHVRADGTVRIHRTADRHFSGSWSSSDYTGWVRGEGGDTVWMSNGLGAPHEVQPDGRWHRAPAGIWTHSYRPMVLAEDGSLVVGDGYGLWRREAHGAISRRWSDELGLPVASVTSLAETPEGGLWVGTDGGGVARLGVDGEVEVFGRPQGLGSDHVTALHLAPDGRLWVATIPHELPGPPERPWETRPEGGGVSLREVNGRWLGIDRVDGLPDDRVQAVLGLEDGGAWIGTRSGLARWSGDAVRAVFGLEEGLPHESVWSILADGAGGVWVGTERGLAHVDAAGRVRAHDAAPGAPSGAIRAMAHGPDGVLWLGVQGRPVSAGLISGGLVRRSPEGAYRAHRWPSTAVLDSNVLDFALTSDGRVWVGTGQGVGRVDLRDGAILPFVTQEALATFDVHGALVDEDGTTWLATAEGIARRDADGHWRIFHLGDGLPGPQVWSVTRGPNGARFFGVGEQLVRGGIGSTGSGGIVRITGRDEIEVLASEAMGGFDPRALEIDDDGGLWVGLAQQLAGGGPARPAGLMRWHPSDGVQLFGPRHGMASERVEELLFDEEGRLYVVHGRTLASGVSVRDPDGHWSVISTMEGLPSLNVTDVALDGRGGLYFTTLAGVGHRHADGTWSTYDRRAGRAGLGFDPVSSVTVDRSGRAWFAALPNVVGPHAGRGLAILNPGGSGR